MIFVGSIFLLGVLSGALFYASVRNRDRDRELQMWLFYRRMVDAEAARPHDREWFVRQAQKLARSLLAAGVSAQELERRYEEFKRGEEGEK